MSRASGETKRDRRRAGVTFVYPTCGRSVTLYVLTVRAPFCCECRQRMVIEAQPVKTKATA